MNLVRYGIRTIWAGECYYGLPKWMNDGEDRATTHAIYCMGGFFPLPLNPIITNMVVTDIIDYQTTGGLLIEMTPAEEQLLRAALASDTPADIEDMERG